ncbi:MAG: response regulator, partial [Bacteroidetes bacterium]|nr:response regulator [Bacteroidota bacterium]
MNLRAVIVDDEEFARENLRIMIQDNCPEIEVVGLAGTIEDARDLIIQTSPDAIFLDIRMPSGAEGFELLDSLPNKDFQVVFVTAFKDYAIRAFQANAVHYILKPIDINELQIAKEKLIKGSQLFEVDKESFNNYVRSLENLTENLRNNLPNHRITIHHSKGIKIIDDSDIRRLEASSNCTIIHFRDGSQFLDTRTMKIYENILDPT